MINNPAKYEPKPPVITKENKTTTEDIAFQTEEQHDDTALVGSVVVKQDGKNGARTIITEYTYSDGNLVGSRVVSDTTVPPVTKIIVIGTKQPEPVDNQPEPPVVAPPTPDNGENIKSWIERLIGWIKEILSKFTYKG